MLNFILLKLVHNVRNGSDVSRPWYFTIRWIMFWLFTMSNDDQNVHSTYTVRWANFLAKLAPWSPLSKINVSEQILNFRKEWQLQKGTKSVQFKHSVMITVEKQYDFQRNSPRWKYQIQDNKNLPHVLAHSPTRLVRNFSERLRFVPCATLIEWHIRSLAYP